MKQVCIYCQTWESGGIEAFISNTLLHMDLSNTRVDIVAEVLKKSIFTDGLIARGVIFRELSGAQRNFARNYWLFSKLMDERKYDVLHLNIFQALPLAYLFLAKRKGIPIRIAHSHNTMLRQSGTRVLKMGIHRTAGRLFSKNATDLWACSADAAEFMFPAVSLNKKAFQFIPNGINLQRFRFNMAAREDTREKMRLENALVIGNVGRLCRQKNQSFLIDIFAQVYVRNASARLLLVGEGEALAELKEKVGRLSLTDAVIFCGTTPYVEKLLWAMDVFVFPSAFEGLGIAAIEAQAAGLPTVCSDRVPKEALASCLASCIPLNAPIEQWRDAILHAQSKRIDMGAVEQLESNGFNIDAVSTRILRTYCR